jgi:hypothetical protein
MINVKIVALIFLQLQVYKTLSVMTIGKPEAVAAVDRLLMMGIGMPKRAEEYLSNKKYTCN